MSETLENATNGGENGGNTKDTDDSSSAAGVASETVTKVNGTKDSLNDSGTAGIEEPEDEPGDEEEMDISNEEDTADKPLPKRNASRVASSNLASAKKPVTKKPSSGTPSAAANRGRKSVGAAGGDSGPLKNKLPPYKEVPVELVTKTIIIGKNADFACTLRGELTNIPANKGEGKFGVGEVIWAKMTGYPWWPCMIAIDPQTGKYSRISGASYKTDNVYHVQYFGEPCRGWTTVGMVMPFEGYQKFADVIDEELAKAGDAKNAVKKIQEKYAVKPSLVNKWMESVCEAEKALKLELISRVKLLTFDYAETAPSKTPKAPKPSNKTPKPTKTPKVESEASTSTGITKNTPRAKAGPSAKKPKPKLVLKDSEDADESKLETSVYEFEDDFDADEQTPTFPTWSSRLPNEEEKRKAIFEHADNLLLGKRSTFEEDPFDSDDSDEVYVDSNPPTPAAKDEQDGGDEEQKDDKKPDSANNNETSAAEATPSKRRARKSQKMIELEKSRSEKKSLKRAAAPQTPVKEDTAAAPEQSAKRPKLETKPTPKATTKPPASPKSEAEDDEEETPADDKNDAPMAPVMPEVNGVPSTTGSGKARKFGLTEDSEESSDNASELSASQAASSSARKKPPVNIICFKCGDDESSAENALTLCTGPCGARYHAKCFKFVASPEGRTLCEDCDSGKHPCFVCNDKENLETKKCTNKHCSRFYHLHCIAAHYPSKINETSNSFECPQHSCITCFQKELHFGSSKGAGRQIVSCIKCPVAYHKNQVCIGAGSVELSRNFIICQDHYRTTKYKSTEDRLNVNYCFSCCKNGDLMNCQLCPAAFHKDCLEYEVNTEEPFICVSCKIKFPLHYGDIVWAKSGSYRWWPAKIVSPDEVPQVLMNSHRYGEFPVYFFGSHNYAWSSKGRSYHFDEADTAPKSSGNKKALTATFKKAFIEAQAALIDAKTNKDAIALATLTIKPPKYIHLVQNKYLTPQRVADKSEQIICRCKDAKQDCSDDTCLNRATMDECSASCPLGEKCKNRRMANRENAKVKPLRSTLHGWGLYADEPIKKGQFVIEYVGEIIDQAECERRIFASTKSAYYFLTIDAQSIIDAGPKGNKARFMNHSCEPNCRAEKWNVGGLPRVGLFAVRDIADGEELTFDYQYELQPGQDNIKCTCGTANCRGFVAKGQTAAPKRSAESKKSSAPKRARQSESVASNEAKKENTEHENICNKCGDDGELLMCEEDGCPKSFHLKCVKLRVTPRGRWTCPTHNDN